MSSPYAGLGSDDFAAALVNLFPRGPAWPRDPASVQARFRAAIADMQAQVHGDAVDLVDNELDPARTNNLLGDWETEFGLPDPCVGATQTLEQRHQALLSRITDPGGLSRSRYIELADTLGFAITITEFAPCRCGEAHSGDPIYDLSWLFTWQVNAASQTITGEFQCTDNCTTPLRSWGNGELECAIRARNRPSRTVLFAYSD